MTNNAPARDLSKAFALIHAGSIDSALDELRDIIAADPQFAFAHALYAACTLDKGFAKDALASAEAALAIEPDIVLAHRVVGLAQLKEKNYDEADAALKRAVEIDPDDAESHRVLATYFEQRAMLEEARAEFEEALRCDPSEPSVIASYADFLADKGEYAGAEELLASAPAQAIDHAAILLARGKLALHRGDLAVARDHALWALQLDANNPAAIQLLCQTKIQKNPIMALWWRWAAMMQRFDGKTRIVIVIGLWVAYNIASRTILRQAPDPVQIGAAVTWVSFCILTWVGPGILGRMVENELKTVRLRPTF